MRLYILMRIKVVARSRFELLSQGPEPCMIDLYTTGLFGSKILIVSPN